LLQEFDLVGPEVVLGRSPDCQITIEDPLVSRRHAVIRLTGGRAVVSDLGSRNGVRVNGEMVQGEQELKDGDRVRLGTQELVFSVVGKKKREARPTGFMRVCGGCETPYPDQASECPHCGHVYEDETMSGLAGEPRRSWTFQLLGEVIERAIASGRAEEAERLLRKTTGEVDEFLEAGDRLDPKHLALMAGFAVRLAGMLRSEQWVRWAIHIHREQGQMLADDVIVRLEEMDPNRMPAVKLILQDYVDWWREDQGGNEDEAARAARIEALTR